MKKIIFLSFLMFGLLIFIQIKAFACSCADFPQTPKQRIEAQLRYNQAVFTGKILEITKKPGSSNVYNPDVLIKIKVERSWKEILPEEIFITSELSDGASCGAYFEIGKRYLIFARGADENSLSTYLCNGNTKIEKATEVLKLLGEGEKPRIEVSARTQHPRPLITKTFSIKHISLFSNNIDKEERLFPSVYKLMSKRGTIVDVKAEMITITDEEKHLIAIQKLVDRLDKPRQKTAEYKLSQKLPKNFLFINSTIFGREEKTATS
jgi:hypothetical protein